MFSPQFEMLEPRQFLSGSGCDDTGAASLAHDAHASQMLRPLGYTYPGGGGSTGGGGGGGTSTGGSTSSTRDFTAKLRGTSEVPSRTTTAKGNVTFRLNRAGTSLSFTIKVNGIRNVVAAHLHLGRSSVNGPVVAHLYGPQSPGGGPRSGTLASGTIKARHLMGSLQGKSIKTLVNAIKNGKVYVNVHTDDGNGSSDTGAGDFASGEIRGQVKRT
jgi:hypothetical protein